MSKIYDMIEYIHQNHRLAFRYLNIFQLEISALPEIFITQIKQLQMLSIPITVESYQMLDQIGKNMTELRYLKLYINLSTGETRLTNLNTLKTLSKLQDLHIEVSSSDFSRKHLNLNINELQQLIVLDVKNCFSFTCTLKFSDLTPQHQLRSMKKLRVEQFYITRNMLNLIFKTMRDLDTLRITANRSRHTANRSRQKPLSRNNNAIIGQLKSLQKLEIDSFWVDENFLRNMNLPQLENLLLLSKNNFTVSCSTLIQRWTPASGKTVSETDGN
jgi:hypothetical protein